MKTGLVLSGGGARGAYQAGVIQALCQICAAEKLPNPFHIISGLSAGAINGAYLASHCHELTYAGDNLVKLWKQIKTDRVVDIGPFSFGRTGVKILKQFTTKMSNENKDQLRGLMDTQPLFNLISSQLKFSLIEENIKNKVLEAFTVTATNYSNSHATTFVQIEREFKEWKRVRRTASKAQIKAHHIMASAAIPILFPPYAIDGVFYGDGAIRNTSPLSPSIHLGAEQIIAVGVRMRNVGEELGQLGGGKHPSVGHVLSVLVHGLLMDAIDLDVERLERINDMADAMKGAEVNGRVYNRIDCLWISPSKYLGEIAEKWVKTAPGSLRFFLFGIGSDKEQADLLSYLLFESEYIDELIELGHQDAMVKKDEIVEFFRRAVI